MCRGVLGLPEFNEFRTMLAGLTCWVFHLTEELCFSFFLCYHWFYYIQSFHTRELCFIVSCLPMFKFSADVAVTTVYVTSFFWRNCTRAWGTFRGPLRFYINAENKAVPIHRNSVNFETIQVKFGFTLRHSRQ